MTIGYGRNNFKMSRGSFNYKQSFDWQQALRLLERQETQEGCRLVFEDPKHDEKHYVNISTDDAGRISVKYEADAANATPVNRYWMSLPCQADEHFYGCGETYSTFDLKGHFIRIWVAEHQNTKRIALKLAHDAIHGRKPQKVKGLDKYESYYAQPTFVSSRKYYLHAFLNEYSEFNFQNPNAIILYTQEPLSFAVENADSFTELSEKLSGLLGRQQGLPEWVYEGGIMAVQDWKVDEKGNTVSAERGIQKVDKKIRTAKEAGVKLNGVWCQDWCGCRCTGFGYQVMWNWEYDPVKYPDLPNEIARWKQEGVRYLGYINPFIALEKNLYAEASEKGYCVKDRDGKDYLVTITTFPAAMVDLTNPEAYEWYKDIIKKNMIGIGMGGWMADFGEYLPTDAVLYSGEDPNVLHNQWPAIWARLNREAIDEAGVADDVFFFTRAGHTETIKYSTLMWTGDQHVDWSVDDGLISTVTATLALAMSGYGITHSDVGGYTTIMKMTRTKELLMRWEEMNAFTPVFRGHEGNQPGKDVQFDDEKELLDHLAKFTDIHAGLAPYIKGLVRELSEHGTPVMRPLFYHSDDEALMTERMEYMLGRDVLVAPVYIEGATTRDVLFPKDRWIHLFTGETYDTRVDNSQRVTVDAPIGCPPVFVRKDSPMRDELLNITKNYSAKR